MTNRRGMLALAAAAAGLVVGTAPRTTAQDGGGEPSGATVYTSNADSSSATALDADTMSRAHADIDTGARPESVAVARNGLRVYTGNASAGSLTVIDATTNEPVATVALGTALDVGGGVVVGDVAVSPDDAFVYCTLDPVRPDVKGPRAGSLNGAVSRFDTVTLAEDGVIPLSLVSGAVAYPRAIDVAPDGSAFYVLASAIESIVTVAAAAPGTVQVVQKYSTSDDSLAGSVTVSADARELRISADGATLIVVGEDAPQFFSAATLAPVTGPSADDVGTHVDLAVAGTNVYVLNADFVPPLPDPEKRRGTPKGFTVAPSGPTIDVYTAATGQYVHSIELGGGGPVLGIAAVSDGSRAFVSRAALALPAVPVDPGTVTCVQLGTGTLGASGPTGDFPRRVAVRQAAPTTPVVSYFLPRNINLKLKGAGKDKLIAAGFYDDGGPFPDYTQPVTIDVGGFTRTFTLVKKGKGYFSPKDPVVKFFILPNLRGSSRGRFKMILAKTTLAGLIDPDAPVAFHFRAAGIADAQGVVLLTAGRYTLGKKRGALVTPQFFPRRAKAKVGGANADSIAFVGGFATNGTTPAALADVRFGFGSAFVRVIPGGLFRKRGDTFTFTGRQGRSTFSIKLDFLREQVTVAATNIENGPLDTETITIVLDAGTGAGAYGNVVRIATKKAKRFY